MKHSTPNPLVHETSPYLLQHAYNPVHWYPWGKEALQIAKEKDLPILVSIGYSACHWCHVMERESFEDARVAAFMNEHFVNIKIDREERPDLDHFYMDAVQAISGSGGWPLNVFLTPETKPFFGGTYYPPQKAFNRSSWMDVLQAMRDVFQHKRDEVETQAETLVRHLKNSGEFAATKSFDFKPGVSFFSKESCTAMAEKLLNLADKAEGGFGKAPKFLQTGCLNYLIAFGHLAGHQPSIDHATFTLTKMLRGGIYDQLGGGISRYSTDDEWLIPHFEKMLYDNALFVSSLCDAAQLTGNREFLEGISHTLDFVMTDLRRADGGYYTALDADSEGEEGKFYVWTKQEIEGLLGADAALFCDYYDVTEAGNWEGHNILNVREESQVVAKRHSLTVESLQPALHKSRTVLLAERAKRIPPGLDNKILLSGNALLLTALCKSFGATGRESYRSAAVELSAFLKSNFVNNAGNGMLYHAYHPGKPGNPAFLDDYAYLVEGLTHLQEITGNLEHLVWAGDLINYVTRQFSDEAGRFFYYSDRIQEDIIVRKTELYDGATPSANAVMARNFLYMGIVFEQSDWVERGLSMLYALDDAVQQYPSSFAVWASNYLFQAFGINEIVITGQEVDPILKDLLRNYVPNRVLQIAGGAKGELFPMLKGKLNLDYPEIYLCKDRVCLAPVTRVDALLEAIKKLTTN